MSPADEHILLFVASSDVTGKRQSDEELRAIENAIQRGSFRDRFRVEKHVATRTIDLQYLLLRHRPWLIHVSGSGGPDGSLQVLDTLGAVIKVLPRTMSKLLGDFSNTIKVASLQYCHSTKACRQAAANIVYCLGSQGIVDARSCIVFGESFYQAVAFGKPVNIAFDVAKSALELEGYDRTTYRPALVVKQVSPDVIDLARPIGDHEFPVEMKPGTVLELRLDQKIEDFDPKTCLHRLASALGCDVSALKIVNIRPGSVILEIVAEPSILETTAQFLTGHSATRFLKDFRALNAKNGAYELNFNDVYLQALSKRLRYEALADTWEKAIRGELPTPIERHEDVAHVDRPSTWSVASPILMTPIDNAPDDSVLVIFDADARADSQAVVALDADQYEAARLELIASLSNVTIRRRSECEELVQCLDLCSAGEFHEALIRLVLGFPHRSAVASILSERIGHHLSQQGAESSAWAIIAYHQSASTEAIREEGKCLWRVLGEAPGALPADWYTETSTRLFERYLDEAVKHHMTPWRLAVYARVRSYRKNFEPQFRKIVEVARPVAISDPWSAGLLIGACLEWGLDELAIDIAREIAAAAHPELEREKLADAAQIGEYDTSIERTICGILRIPIRQREEPGFEQHEALIVKAWSLKDFVIATLLGILVAAFPTCQGVKLKMGNRGVAVGAY